MNNASLPIETTREGNRITKVCVEDIYKIINRIKFALNKSYTNANTLLNNIQKDYKGLNGKFIIGTGVSQPCITDAFDEEIGNNIAFMKAKLNANIKKFKLLKKVLKEIIPLTNTIVLEMERLEEYIDLDLDGIRKHNPDYLKNLEI